MADETGTVDGGNVETAETPKPKRTAKRAAKRNAGFDINKPTPGYTGPTGNRFMLKSEPRTVKPTGQIPLIVAAMRRAGKRGFTAVDIADAIKADVQTVQTPLRVVRYYISEWRKRGHIVAVS